MGSVQAAMALLTDSLVDSDLMMADEMEDFIGHSASDGPVANETLCSSAGSTGPIQSGPRCSAIGLLAGWIVVAANQEEAVLEDHRPAV